MNRLWLAALLAGFCFGYKPLPAPGCYVLCICDRYGQNCTWTQVCH